MIAINEQTTEDIGSANKHREPVSKFSDLMESLIIENRRLKDTIEQQRGSLMEKDREADQLKAKLAASEKVATEWNRTIRHRDELASWLIDQAFTNGKQVKYTVDAALGGEDFIPCSHECEVPESVLPGGRKVKLELLETVYSVTLV